MTDDDRLVGSTAYLESREQLRLAELALVDHREEVAALRRAMPIGPEVHDHALVEGAFPLEDPRDDAVKVRLSALFSAPERTLIVYHLMFGKRQTSPCPMCTMWVDGFDPLVRHVTQRADIAVVAAAPVHALRAHARARGWRSIRFVSAGESSFKRDLGSEDAAGNQYPVVTVLRRDGDRINLTYSGSPAVSEDRDERGIDLLCATWGLLDLTPEGRGDWYASLGD